MQIRDLRTGDQSAVQEIMVPHPWQFPQRIIDSYPERWNRFLNAPAPESHGFFVAELNGVVGHAGYIYSESLRLCEIVGVLVKQGLQGQGIGTSIIHFIFKHIKSLGHDKVILYTLEHPANARTIHFYQKLGFKTVAHDPDFWGPSYDRITFIRELDG